MNNLMQFQFPSNGKGVPKDKNQAHLLRAGTTVSIPFKRERGSKVGLRESQGFIEAFQFPSNGKGVPKTAEPAAQRLAMSSFNSLQTGKGFQSKKCSKS